MALSGQQEMILDLLIERGPISDDSLAGEVIGDQGSADDVASLTQELEEAGLITESEFAPRRWQITDDGRKARS